MTSSDKMSPPHDPIASSLSAADDRVRLSEVDAAIEFVQDYANLGAGEGGFNEDHEFYGYRVPI